MSNHANPAKRERRDGGFTLIEVMVVVAIIGVLTALSMVAYDSVGKRGALQNAAFDLQGTLTLARSEAVSRGYPIWIVLYTTASRKAPTGTTGQGAFLMVEDTKNDFVRAPAGLFALPLKSAVGVPSVYFLEDYSKQVRFEAATPGVAGRYSQPFSTLNVQTCGFCSGTPLRGAIVFNPDGSARFVDGQGQYIAVANQALAFSSLDRKNQYLFAISGPSGYVAAFSP
ncbi:GspH/FimT family pseudopilin [Vitiosangium sp. GDMCC 1.1324]|uniref:GspH/FimT family pseudopilin n=1 Tax=Vitiosangium sp. (strain GDMCC 1.1324) TaxID=2138576 RepID=UPI000D343F76|nr:GspH/FimT family pseudopilin [Vitiosangium sp. GDMCC 1.1324]PTL77654.1 prepilin-type cleavage/methylation domain-containing protein [Vitiosangium sp. GDMCC 1.1324]